MRPPPPPPAHSRGDPTVAPPDLLDVAPDCPPHMAAAVMRMMEKNPDDRFASLEDALTALRTPQAAVAPLKAVRDAAELELASPGNTAYVGESLLLVACFLAGPRPLALLPLAAAGPCIVMRILAEESLLKESATYREYAEAVRWRLIPWVW